MSSISYLPGLSYGLELANKFGLDHSGASELAEPLLGASIEIYKGNSGGSLCSLHLIVKSNSDIRFPQEEEMVSPAVKADRIPFIFIKKPAKDIRMSLGLNVAKWANLYFIRFGLSALKNSVIATKDKEGSYSNMPIERYSKNFVEGMTHISISLNCAMAALDNYKDVSVYFESSKSPKEMIQNLQVDPAQMTVIKVPFSLFTGMKDDLKKAVKEDDFAKRNIQEKFKIIK